MPSDSPQLPKPIFPKRYEKQGFAGLLLEDEKSRTRACKLRTRINRKRSRKKGTPCKIVSRNPWSKHDNAITKPEKISVLKELEDTDTFLEGPRSGHEDH